MTENVPRHDVTIRLTEAEVQALNAIAEFSDGEAYRDVLGEFAARVLKAVTRPGSIDQQWIVSGFGHRWMGRERQGHGMVSHPVRGIQFGGDRVPIGTVGRTGPVSPIGVPSGEWDHDDD